MRSITAVVMLMMMIAFLGRSSSSMRVWRSGVVVGVGRWGRHGVDMVDAAAYV